MLYGTMELPQAKDEMEINYAKDEHIIPYHYILPTKSLRILKIPVLS